MPRDNHFDAIVLGLGAMGSATLDAFAQRGVRVLGIERFSIPHEHGSSGGDSRLIRKAYFEDPSYVPLLQRAYENWAALEARGEERVLYRTGIVHLDVVGGSMIRGSHASAQQHGLLFEPLNHDDLRRRCVGMQLPEGYEAAWEPDGGFLLSSLAIRLYAELALRSGVAHIRAGEQVTGWRELPDGVEVCTSTETFHADRLVVCAGSWTQGLLPALAIPLVVTRQPLFWTWPPQTKIHHLGQMPCWIAQFKGLPGQLYGFPMLPASMGGQLGLKIAHHFAGQPVDPDAVAAARADEFTEVREPLKEFFSVSLGPVVATKVCRYTSTPDHHFVVDQYPGSKRVVFGAGFSGHGFKFASVMGEVLADLAMNGKTPWPIAFLRADRFSSQPTRP